MKKESLIKLFPKKTLEKALRVGDSVFTSHEKAVIEAAYMRLFNKKMRQCTCRNRYTDAALEIQEALKLNEINMKRNYELKAGHLIWVDNKPYSKVNITDKIAEKWCKAHPGEVELFFSRYKESSEDESIIKD